MAFKTTLKIFDEHGILYDTAATFGRRSFKLGDVVTDRRPLRADPVEDTTARIVRAMVRAGVVREVREGGPFEVLARGGKDGGVVLGDELDAIEIRIVRADEDEGALTYTLEVSVPESALEYPSSRKRGLSTGYAWGVGSAADVTKARAAMAAAAAELAAKNPHWRDPARKVRVAVGALNKRWTGLRPATMGDADVFEALARHGLAEPTGKGLGMRPGHLTSAAGSTLSEQDWLDVRDELDDYPRY